MRLDDIDEDAAIEKKKEKKKIIYIKLIAT